MFKLIFRTIILIVFLIFLAIGLAFWKGGEPFRSVGGGIVTIGEKVSEAGDLVDDMISGGKQVKKSYNEFKDAIDTNDK